MSKSNKSEKKPFTLVFRTSKVLGKHVVEGAEGQRSVYVLCIGQWEDTATGQIHKPKLAMKTLPTTKYPEGRVIESFPLGLLSEVLDSVVAEIKPKAAKKAA